MFVCVVRAFAASSFTIVLLFKTAVAAESLATIQVVADPYCPYNCAVEAPQIGYVVELIRLIYEPAGYQVEYQTIPWSRALQAVERGTFSAAIGASRDTGSALVLPKQPVGVIRTGFIKRKGDQWRYLDHSSLVEITLGAVANYDYGSKMNAYLKDNAENTKVLQLRGEDAVKRNLLLLQRGRIDTFLVDFNVGLYMARKLGIQQQMSMGELYGDALPIYLGFSPARSDAQHLADLYDAGIRKLRNNGQLDVLLNRYGLTDWQ
ncbi:MAG: transporter substrate-binding domain-containing protein [Halopseudomonas sp.]